MKKSLFLCIVLISCSSQPVAIEDLKPSVKAMVHHCQSCHSNREMQRGPRLEGLEEWYLEASVMKFKKGQRGKNPDDKNGQLMYAAVKDLPEEDVLAAARWFANQPRPEIKAFVKGDVKKGEQLYKNGCYNCHDHTMGKFFSKSPDLYKLEDWYLMMQLRGYKSKIRGSHPEDERGLKMRDAVQIFTDQQFKDIVAYLAQFQENPNE